MIMVNARTCSKLMLIISLERRNFMSVSIVCGLQGYHLLKLANAVIQYFIYIYENDAVLFHKPFLINFSALNRKSLQMMFHGQYRARTKGVIRCSETTLLCVNIYIHMVPGYMFVQNVGKHLLKALN